MKTSAEYWWIKCDAGDNEVMASAEEEGGHVRIAVRDQVDGPLRGKSVHLPPEEAMALAAMTVNAAMEAESDPAKFDRLWEDFKAEIKRNRERAT